ncbi:ABC-2 type transport system permease protein [Anaerosolibacter carboniphilus]|uniref:ABC-2 type transport system permease protein n=1 Tax=Anaerosolibacter carboniphilus TaxID=1417629 RepID=A0A841L3Z6_9FIRM|nr:ABC transporter permease [Anaerosolibacter carboniphilus]MBB6217109.1 ABC-2 type transport system permease protein [Anaerosolibacter carboniphilus]
MSSTMLKTMKREWDKMIREKMIFIVILFIPFLVNILIGFEFSKNQIQNISMAIYDQDNSSLSRMIAQQFAENEIFHVNYYIDNSEQMKQLFDESHIRVGMIIPKNFSKDVAELKSPTIMMIYDGSHMSIASTAKSKASEILLTLKTGILIKLIEGKLSLPADVAEKMALSIKFSNRMLYNPAKSFKNFLNPGFSTAIVQTAIVLMGAVAIRTEEIEGGKRNRIGYYLGKALFYSIMGGISLIMSIWIQSNIFDIPFRGQMREAILLSFVLSMAVAVFSLTISVWVKHEMLATQINAVLFIPNTIMVGYTWPLIAMPKPYQILGRLFPFYRYADNLRDMFLKGSSLSHMMKDIQWLIIYIAFVSFVGLLGMIFFRKTETEELGKEMEAIVLS